MYPVQSIVWGVIDILLVVHVRDFQNYFMSNQTPRYISAVVDGNAQIRQSWQPISSRP